ncbi:T9SS type A sorting domain-containing protein [Fibrella sp. USSR17]
MKHLFTCLCTLGILFMQLSTAHAQETLNPARLRWSAPLSTSTIKTVVDAAGNTWVLSAPNTFQVIDLQGKVSWTKTVSALSVTDFAVDAQGQVVLVGLPANGQPVLEKYDANQTLAWRNVLDSLSNVPGQAGYLTVTLNALGSSVVTGVNTAGVRQLTCYVAQADGRLTRLIAATTTNPMLIRPIRPVVYNGNDVLVGFQADTVNVKPSLFNVKTAPQPAIKAVDETLLDGPRYALNNSSSSSLPATRQSSLPFFSDGQTAYIGFKANYLKAGTQVDSAQAGYVLYGQRVTTNPSADYQFNRRVLEYGTTDSRAISVAASRYMSTRGNLITTQTVSNSVASSFSSDLIINEYQTIDETTPFRDNKRFLLINSLNVGTVRTTGSSSPSQETNRLTVLTRTSAGTLVLAGITSGTMTVGNVTFTGTQAAPTQFLVAVGPDPLFQTLSTDQVGWSANLPVTTQKVITNARKQSWVQLPDNTFRYYDGQGKVGWEKKMSSATLYDAKADQTGNLYLMAVDSISVYDTTGALTRRFLYQQGQRGYNYQLYIKTNGSGMAIWSLPYGPSFTFTQFDAAGNLNAPVNPWSLNNPTAQFSVKPLPLPNQQTVLALSSRTGNNLTFRNLSFLSVDPQKGFGSEPVTFDVGRFAVNDLYPYSVGSNLRTDAFLDWTGFDGQNTYFTTTHSYGSGTFAGFYGYGLIKADSTRKTVFSEVNTARANAIALSFARAVNSSGTFYTLATRPETATPTGYELVLTEYATTFTRRNTTRIGSISLTSGQPDNTSVEIVQAYADGSLLLSGLTNGTVTIGTNTYAGTTTSPARFLLLMRSVVTQLTAPATAICQGSSAALRTRYKGYVGQQPVVQVANVAGNFTQPVLTLTVPLSQSAVTDTTLSSLSIPIPATLAAGVYRVRTVLGTSVSELGSLTVTAAPAAPTAKQEGDELVGMGTGTYQWYDAQNRPISNATNPRFTPQAAGSYYVINTVNGCSSAASATISYVITATEPDVVVNVYPNPTAERLYVQWPGAGAQARIKLVTTQGRVVQDVARQGDLTVVSTQDLASGLLLVQLQAEGQPTQVRKVLIQR